jgi:glycosyltransferase involved in cell wall biosynthesis
LGRGAALFAYPRPAVVHTPHGHIFQGYYGRVMTGLFILMERLAARATHATVALTPKERADHLALNIGTPESFLVVPSGVDIEEFTEPKRSREEVREELGLGPDEPVALTVGRLVEVKAQHFLLDAAALILRENPGARFVLVGEGPLRNSLGRQAERLGIAERVVFTGFRNDVADILHAADLFVLTSLNEGMGRVLVEAMAAGLPAVAFGVGGVVDLVDGEVGALISPFDVAEFARAAGALLEDPALRAELSQNAKARSRQYSTDAMLEGLDHAYRAAAKLRRGA